MEWCLLAMTATDTVANILELYQSDRNKMRLCVFGAGCFRIPDTFRAMPDNPMPGEVIADAEGGSLGSLTCLGRFDMIPYQIQCTNLLLDLPITTSKPCCLIFPTFFFGCSVMSRPSTNCLSCLWSMEAMTPSLFPRRLVRTFNANFRLHQKGRAKHGRGKARMIRSSSPAMAAYKYALCPSTPEAVSFGPFHSSLVAAIRILPTLRTPQHIDNHTRSAIPYRPFTRPPSTRHKQCSTPRSSPSSSSSPSPTSPPPLPPGTNGNTSTAPPPPSPVPTPSSCLEEQAPKPSSKPARRGPANQLSRSGSSRTVQRRQLRVQERY